MGGTARQEDHDDRLMIFAALFGLKQLRQGQTAHGQTTNLKKAAPAAPITERP